MWWSWRLAREVQAGTAQRQPSRAKTGSRCCGWASHSWQTCSRSFSQAFQRGSPAGRKASSAARKSATTDGAAANVMSASSMSSLRAHICRSTGARVAPREAKALCDIAGRRREAEGAVQAKVKEGAEEDTHLPVDALHGAAGDPQALVDHEGVARGAELEELLHVLGDRHFDGGPAGVGRRVDGLRWGFAERAVVDGSGRGGGSLGGDDLGGGSERELAPRHTAGELDRLAPAGAQPSRAAEREAEAVALVGVGGRARDERLERANRPVARERQPLALAVGRGRRGEETRLRPRQVARSEGGGNGREALEP